LPDHELEPLRAFSDDLVSLRNLNPPDRLRPQLFARCTEPWILSIDSDEVVSEALLRALPRLLAAEDVVQYRIARRWLFPDAAHWLEEVPWWPDFQTRLVRRDSAAIAGPGPHDGLLAEEPARFVLEPLYHLDCALNSVERRAAKAAYYERASPGRRPFGGGPFNETFYLPERFATRMPAAVPAADRDRIASVLDADPRPREAVLRADGPTRVDDVELATHDYAVELCVVELDTRFAPGESRPLLVDVCNLGTTAFPGGARSQPEIRLTYRLRDSDDQVIVTDGLRTHFPVTIAPGAHELVPALVEAPATPGRYIVEFDLVHEGARWFDQPVTVDILVAARWSQFRAPLDDR
jgi:hypothetical protein